MFAIVFRSICFTVAAAASIALLFGSLFDESTEHGSWISPTEANAAPPSPEFAVATVEPPRGTGNLWKRRASSLMRGEATTPLPPGKNETDRSMALALQPVDVERELEAIDPAESPRGPRPGGDRESDAEWLRVHTPPKPPPLESEPPDAESENREAGPGATVITANSAANYEKDGRLVLFEGGVNLKGPDFSLESNRLDVHMGGGGTRPDQMIAYGDVVVRTAGQGDSEKSVTASAQRATFDPSAETLLLQGWPQVTDSSGRNVAASEAGSSITIHTQTGKIVTSGRTRSRLSMD